MTSWSPWLEVEADRLVIDGDSLSIRVKAEANGDTLRDLVVYAAGKKVLYRPLASSNIDLSFAVPITEAGPALVEVIVRKDRHSSATERIQVFRRLEALPSPDRIRP
jgi:hypothetical protein